MWTDMVDYSPFVLIVVLTSSPIMPLIFMNIRWSLDEYVIVTKISA